MSLGRWSKYRDFTLLALLKAKKVIAIEPDPDTFGVLQKNVASLANVTLINRTVGDSHRFVRIEGNGVNACVADDSNGAIEVDRIDNILLPLSVSQTILRMDIKEFEFNALKEEKLLSHVRRAVIETHSS